MKPRMRTWTQLVSEPTLPVASLPYGEAPVLPGCPGLFWGAGLYLDRVCVRGEPASRETQPAGRPLVLKPPYLLTVEVDMYVGIGERGFAVLHHRAHGGAGATDGSGGAHISYRQSGPRSIRAYAPQPTRPSRAPPTSGSPFRSGSVGISSSPPTHAYFPPSRGSNFTDFRSLCRRQCPKRLFGQELQPFLWFSLTCAPRKRGVTAQILCVAPKASNCLGWHLGECETSPTSPPQIQSSCNARTTGK